MVRAVVHKEGDRVYLEVAADDPKVAALRDGEELSVTLGEPASPELSDDEFNELVDRLIDEHRDALDYLAQ